MNEVLPYLAMLPLAVLLFNLCPWDLQFWKDIGRVIVITLICIGAVFLFAWGLEQIR